MQEAMHAARLVAAQSALLALLIEQQDEHIEVVDGITVTLALSHEAIGTTCDVIYTANGRPVSGEGA